MRASHMQQYVEHRVFLLENRFLGAPWRDAHAWGIHVFRNDYAIVRIALGRLSGADITYAARVAKQLAERHGQRGSVTRLNTHY